LFTPSLVSLANILQLHKLALHEVRNDRCKEFDYLGVTETSEGNGGSTEEEITSQDGHFVAEDGDAGGVVATGEGGVDYVVVEEGGCVDHFCDFGETTLGGSYTSTEWDGNVSEERMIGVGVI
jgi:hypothetical protein